MIKEGENTYMRWLINYIRSCFCKHDWELIKHEEAYNPEYSWLTKRHDWIYRCKKCGYMKTYRNY